jgi:hypothetical protein
MNSKRDEELEHTLRRAAPDAFGAGFGDRVVRRLAREGLSVARSRTPDFTTVLERQFLRVVPLLAAASLVLGVYSWWGGRNSAESVFDATLRLPQVSIATAYEPEVLYGDAGGEE